MKHVAFTGAGRLSQPRQALTDLDVQVLIRPADLTPSAEQVLVGEFLTTGNLRGWSVRLRTDGAVDYRFSNNGTASIAKTSTATIASAGYVDGDKFWLRVVHDVNNGAAGYDVKFYTSDDGTTWTQLGSTVTTATATTIFSSASNVITLGGEGTAATYVGKVYEVRVYSTIGGTTNLVDPEPWDWSTATYGASGVSTVTPSLTATEQDVYPPRVLVSAINIEVDDSVTFFRSVASDRTAVRGASDVVPGDTAMVRVDAELPFEVPVTYVMVLNDDEEYSTSPMTVALTGGNVALSDAITGAAAEVKIFNAPELRYDRPSSRFVVGGRNVLVTGLMPGFTGTIELLTEALASADNVRDLLEGATQGVIQLRSSEQPENNAYIAVPGYAVMRTSQDGTDPRRRFVLDVVEVEPWAADVEAAGVTYQDLQDAYTGLTYNDLAGDYATYLALAQADFT